MIYADSIVSELQVNRTRRRHSSGENQKCSPDSFPWSHTVENLYKLPNPHYTAKRLLPCVCGLSFQLVPALSPSPRAPLGSPGFTHGSRIRWTCFWACPRPPPAQMWLWCSRGHHRGVSSGIVIFRWSCAMAHHPCGPADICLQRLWPPARGGGSLLLLLSGNVQLHFWN